LEEIDKRLKRQENRRQGDRGLVNRTGDGMTREGKGRRDRHIGLGG
jgi:hypothetical protein